MDDRRELFNICLGPESKLKMKSSAKLVVPRAWDDDRDVSEGKPFQFMLQIVVVLF